MYLKKLDLRGIRNLQSTQLCFHPQINFIYGDNGSGKTSLLEAIYLLGRGRSFRTTNPTTVLNRQADDLLIAGAVQPSTSASVIPLGMHRRRSGEVILKVRGERIYASSGLAETLPLLLFNSDSFLLLEGGPKGRRSYLDWGVFHVEHSYREIWSRFQRVLRQRNSALRHGKIDPGLLAAWDTEFVGLAGKIDDYRKNYIDRLIPTLESTVTDLIQDLPDIHFDYYPGWDRSKSLADVLSADFSGDKQYGMTRHGPHRADLRVRVGRNSAVDLLSRGQTKMIVAAMQLAQGRLFNTLSGRRCLYLVDDLPSELDTGHRCRLAELLSRLGSQVFVTGVEKDDLIQSWPVVEKGDCGVFHVEHGEIKNETLG